MDIKIASVTRARGTNVGYKILINARTENSETAVSIPELADRTVQNIEDEISTKLCLFRPIIGGTAVGPYANIQRIDYM